MSSLPLPRLEDRRVFGPRQAPLPVPPLSDGLNGEFEFFFSGGGSRCCAGIVSFFFALFFFSESSAGSRLLSRTDMFS